MPPRVAKKGAVKKTPPPKLKKAEVPAELEESPVETPVDEAPVDMVVEEKVAVDEDFSAAEVAEEVEAAEEAAQEVDGSDEEDSGEDDAVNDVEEDAEDGMQAEEGKQEHDNPSDIKVKLEEQKDENVDNPEIDGDTLDGDIGEGDNEKHDDIEDPSSFLPTSEESRKQKEGEIFVGGLSKKATEDDLIKVFSVVGEVQAARIARSLPSNKSMGFAFIQYATIEHAKKALAEMKDGVEVLGKRVAVSASTANNTLYVGNICKTWTSDQVLETLKNLGVEHNNEILLPNDPTSEGKNKGHAFLDFNSHVAAMVALQRLKSPDAYFGCDKRAKVAFAHSMRHINEETPSQVKTVYVEGLSPSWDEEKLKDLGKAYGEVEKVDIVRRAGRNKKIAFGFIAFSSHESALACVEGINKTEVAEGEIKMTANLARFDRKRQHSKEQKVDHGGAENSDVPKNDDKMPNPNVKNAKAKKQTKTGNKIAQGHKKVPEHSGGRKRKVKMDSDFRGPHPKRQRGDWGAGKNRHRSSRYAAAGTGHASHSSDLEPHAGLLPSGRHGGHIPARRSHRNQPDEFAVHVGGHSDPYSYPRYANYPGYRGSYPYGGSAQYPPRRAYY